VRWRAAGDAPETGTPWVGWRGRWCMAGGAAARWSAVGGAPARRGTGKISCRRRREELVPPPPRRALVAAGKISGRCRRAGKNNHDIDPLQGTNKKTTLVSFQQQKLAGYANTDPIVRNSGSDCVEHGSGLLDWGEGAAELQRSEAPICRRRIQSAPADGLISRN
jgi:hypothetical protein